jgi:hypothetical protein
MQIVVSNMNEVIQSEKYVLQLNLNVNRHVMAWTFCILHFCPLVVWAYPFTICSIQKWQQNTCHVPNLLTTITQRHCECAFLCWFYTKMCWNLIRLIINSIPPHKSNHLLMHAHP